ncbi:hypothetical protein PPERSA_04651 [Pseudocohnilembus persalinus]|uniref:Uncharacterized protein n=1 Tax=Pseudocohnilembus persalinus TaxID=266149 RepID=A0A0V0QPC4_PSEPJ|nr:hypothetical protein PPERSA_04651 [Pseudocohnilembus persalinus]|eukprot:KRX03856.1 hypothetical protein PPERSA_04651 [Pseudocohnilembus persalinus]
MQQPKKTQEKMQIQQQQIEIEKPQTHKHFSDYFTMFLDQTPFLGRIDEAPQYIIDNVYILTGYRINFHSSYMILKSLFMIHNETLNIWTHLIGCIIAIAMCVDIALYDPYPGRELSKWPIFMFVISGMCCFGFSSCYHLFFVKNPYIAKILLRLDYAGITFLICGSTFPLTYYGFYCQQAFQWFYLSLIFGIGMVVFTITMMDFIYAEKYRHIKSLIYAFYGAFCGLSIIQLLIQEHLQGQNPNLPCTSSTLFYYVTMGFVDYTGLYIYALRQPEKNFPGKFDICGHSHQIMHVSNMVGMLVTYQATLIHYQQRIEYGCPV